MDRPKMISRVSARRERLGGHAGVALMSFTQGFLGVDWGTSNRRAYHIGPDGRLLAEHEDDKGILAWLLSLLGVRRAAGSRRAAR